jgi:hypothetical protein
MTVFGKILRGGAKLLQNTGIPGLAQVGGIASTLYEIKDSNKSSQLAVAGNQLLNNFAQTGSVSGSVVTDLQITAGSPAEQFFGFLKKFWYLFVIAGGAIVGAVVLLKGKKGRK